MSPQITLSKFFQYMRRLGHPSLIIARIDVSTQAAAGTGRELVFDSLCVRHGGKLRSASGRPSEFGGLDCQCPPSHSELIVRSEGGADGVPCCARRMGNRIRTPA